MQQPGPIQVEVFRAGDYGPKGVYTEDDLKAIAEDYDTTRHEAPVTLDHAQHGPAHGWVTGLQCLGNRLVATLARLSPALADALRQHAFRKRSVELYRRFAGTDRPYLKAVSFLGAAAPEVKGLADPVFTEDADAVRFEEERPTAAETARMALMAAGAWNPAWEEQGIGAVFEALAPAETVILLRILEEGARPVSLGATPTAEGDLFREPHDIPVDGASADSIARHRAALAAMRQNPTTSYRDALLAIR